MPNDVIPWQTGDPASGKQGEEISHWGHWNGLRWSQGEHLGGVCGTCGVRPQHLPDRQCHTQHLTSHTLLWNSDIKDIQSNVKSNKNTHPMCKESSTEMHLRLPRFVFLKESLIWQMGGGLGRAPLCEVNGNPTSIPKEESSFLPESNCITQYKVFCRV